MPAIALTDHGALYGAVDFYVAANQAGIKPILGVETYVARTNRFERDPRLEGHGKPFHLVLLAKNFTGYRNLVSLVDRKSTRLNSSHSLLSRMPSSA